MSTINFQTMKDAVADHANQYEDALASLETAANTSGGTGGTLSISQATLATTKVQIHQSLTDMAQGIAKNAADHVKGQGRKISG
jgi:hypothetical protein